MSLIDDPFYRSMIEGNDTQIVVGTLTVALELPGGLHPKAFPIFLIDYHGFSSDMEPFVADAFDDAKKINLDVKDGAYTVEVEEKGAVTLFAYGEQATHTAPIFWAQYTPAPEEHAAFQREYARTYVWMLMIITYEKLHELVVAPDGTVLFKRVVPLTDELKKVLGVESET